MTPGQNCKAGSAWHDWQIAGAEWRKLNPNGDAEQAARDFAAFEAHPLGQSARYRAFMECAA